MQQPGGFLSMKIINIESNGNGYKGIFTEDYHHYNRFNISPAKHQIIPLRTTSEIGSLEEFIDMWNKCDQSTRFLEFPIEIQELSLNTLRNIAENRAL
jgi:hypothetical protein